MVEGSHWVGPAAAVSARLLWILGAAFAQTAWGATTITFRDGQSPTAAYAGTRDVRIYDGADQEWSPTTNYGATPSLALDGNPIDKGLLIRWDVSAIPTSATVTGASIELELTDGTSTSYSIYECLRSWSETEVTWNRARSGVPWATPGAQGGTDRGTTILGSITAGVGTATVPLNASGVSRVQSWVSNPSTNLGLVIVNYAAFDGLIALSSEDASTTRRPALIVVTNQGSFTFRDGESPTTAYAGTQDAVIGNGPDPKTISWNAAQLVMNGSTHQSSALVSFDLSAIPPWATIQDASLVFLVKNASVDSFSVWEVLPAWTEDATWFTYDGVSGWSAPGTGSGDRGALITTIAPAMTGTLTVPLGASGAQLVQDWVRGNKPNRGFQIVNDAATDLCSFDDREQPTANRPGFAVTYAEGKLVFLSAPQTLAAGFPSGALVVQRQRLDGTPIDTGAPALNVTVASSSPTAEFAPSPSPYQTWTASYPVTLPAGASTTPVFHVRDPVEGSPTLTASAGAAWDPGTFPLSIGPFQFADDAETGTLLDSETPPGRWTQRSAPTVNALLVTGAAAHRGSFGVRHEDTSAGAGGGNEGAVEVRSAGLTGDVHLRFWFRVVALNGSGEVVFAHIRSPADSLTALAFQAETGAFREGGFDRTGAFSQILLNRSVDLGVWHLMEVAALGVGTANGTAKTWMDGVPLGTRSGLDWSTLEAEELSIGEPWGNPRTFTGTMDFDDVRAGRTAPASTLVVTAPAASSAGTCIPVTVSLRSSDGALAPAPYPMDAALTAAGVSGQFYAETTCATPIAQVTLVTGADGRQIGFLPSSGGDATLVASHPDFLSAPGGTVVGTAPDAGPADGGSDDGGASTLPVVLPPANVSASCGAEWRYVDPELGSAFSGEQPFYELKVPAGGASPESLTLDPSSGELSWRLPAPKGERYQLELWAHGAQGAWVRPISLSVECGDPVQVAVGCGCQAGSRGGAWLFGAAVIWTLWAVRRARIGRGG